MMATPDASSPAKMTSAPDAFDRWAVRREVPHEARMVVLAHALGPRVVLPEPVLEHIGERVAEEAVPLDTRRATVAW
jgi:hypothetical protein